MKKILITICATIITISAHSQDYLPLTGGTLNGRLVIGANYDNSTLSRFTVYGAGSSYFDIWKDANQSPNLSLVRSDGAEVFKIMGHSMIATFNGMLNGTSANFQVNKPAELGAELSISNGFSNKEGAVRLNLNNGGAVSWIKGLVTGSDTNTGSAMVFGVPSINSDGIERMRITSTGALAIGTTDPQDYKLAVAGKVRATEIKVEALPWPDYVFHSSYKLPDLKITEQFIKANKHLPEIPSASEVEKQGVNLGEMNAKLLKKIEELTLYMIDFNKKMEVIQEENQTLKTKVAQLESNK